MAKTYKRKIRKPTQEQLEALDAEFRIKFTDLMAGWATCESHLRIILAELVGTDEWAGDLIMYTTMSTRARVDMVQRLAILTYGSNSKRTKHLQKLLREFKAVTELRNRLAHCVYDFKTSMGGGDIGIIVGGTFVNFLKSNFDGGNMYEPIVIGRDLFNQMRQMIERARSLAGRFRRFADSFRHTKQTPRALPPSQLWKRRKAKERRERQKKEQALLHQQQASLEKPLSEADEKRLALASALMNHKKPS